MSASQRGEIVGVRGVIGLEVHVELATRRKLFAGVGNPAHEMYDGAGPNELTDAVVLALPGSLPVVNERAIELSMRVGVALGCELARRTRWDRKGYFYPDLPKGYQISQYADPVCGRGEVIWPIGPGGALKRIGIERAHLEEDAGKLLHELPAGQGEREGGEGAGDFSIVDLNRAGTPLLEIVTAPDFETADEVVAFAKLLRNVCRHLRVSRCVMQKGHIRFEPNINCVITLRDGRVVRTPITEVKNLNSFRSVQGAIEHELREQPARWSETGVEHAPGTKTTRGWDDGGNKTILQREKEEAHDYRYFPDPDLLAVEIDDAWAERVRAAVGEMPHERAARWGERFGLDEREQEAMIDDPDTADLFDDAASITGEKLGRLAANIILQTGMKIANERGVTVAGFGLTAGQLAVIAQMRDAGEINAGAVEPLIAAVAGTDEDARAGATRLGLVQVRDEKQLLAWCRAAVDDPANASSIADLRAGKQQAIGRLVGAVMKASGGNADAKAARVMLLELVQNWSGEG